MSRLAPAAAEIDLVDDQAFAVLNAIYLHKMATPTHIADVTNLDQSRVEASRAGPAAVAAVLALDGAFLLQEEGTARVLAFYRHRYAALR
ncbi:hypothetical protein ABTN16_19285, partial [Acinetobacter baumannii]